MIDNRYIRQITLKDFGEDGQNKLAETKVLVVGAGGLGIPVLQYLTSMGIGQLGIVEHDIVELSNLQRQVIYKENDIGHNKINKAVLHLSSLNSNVRINPYKTSLNKGNAMEIISDYDVVVDASDNFPTRYLINDACVILNKPFVYGALHGFEGQVSVFNYQNGPTYRCLYPTIPKTDEIKDCNENGVLGIIPGIIGCLQALEVVKIITNIGNILTGQLLIYDGLSQEINKLSFPTNKSNKSITELQESYGELPCSIEHMISASSFMAELNHLSNNSIIDVRSVEEYHIGSLANSINIPMNRLDDLDHDTRLKSDLFYVLCQSGRRSKQAVGILQSKFPEKKFINVEGGYNSIAAQLIKSSK